MVLGSILTKRKCFLYLKKVLVRQSSVYLIYFKFSYFCGRDIAHQLLNKPTLSFCPFMSFCPYLPNIDITSRYMSIILIHSELLYRPNYIVKLNSLTTLLQKCTIYIYEYKIFITGKENQYAL